MCESEPSSSELIDSTGRSSREKSIDKHTAHDLFVPIPASMKVGHTHRTHKMFPNKSRQGPSGVDCVRYLLL